MQMTKDQRPTTPNSSPISAVTPKRLHLRLRVQPRASRTELAGVQGDALRVRVSAPPVDGAANEALVRFLAEVLRVRPSAIRLITGETSRSKVVAIEGMQLEQAASLLGLGGSCPGPSAH